jgi:uncharacterized protein
MHRLIALVIFFWSYLLFAEPVTIPNFTPNVVDLAGELTPSERSEINEAIQALRTRDDILAAVFIIKSLQGEPIESLSERTFRAWKIGSAGKDNGLLLVLATEDRESRFEVGYGLEGDLPDIIARHALDQVLAPKMRKGETKNAIIDSLNYMGAIKSKTQIFTADTTSQSEESTDILQTDSIKKGALAIIVYLICLWFSRPFALFLAKRRARRLQKASPDYKMDEDTTFTKSAAMPIFVRMFLSINPGLFILLFATMNPIGNIGLAVIIIMISAIYIRLVIQPYSSIYSYQKHQVVMRKRQSSSTKSSSTSGSSSGSRSSSSSSSRSSSSSSGGGRSGGGGSSSRW